MKMIYNRKILQYALIIFTFILLSDSILVSQDSIYFQRKNAEYVKWTISFYPQTFTKITNNEYFLTRTKVDSDVGFIGYQIYHYDQDYFSLLDSNEKNMVLKNINWSIYSSYSAHGTLYLFGVEDYYKPIFVYNTNGVWGNWVKDSLARLNDSISYKALYVRRVNDNEIYINAVFEKDSLFYSHFYYKMNNLDTFSINKLIFNLHNLYKGGFSAYGTNQFYPASKGLLYYFIDSMFYRVNLLENKVDTIKIFNMNEYGEKAAIKEMNFFDENTGFIFLLDHKQFYSHTEGDDKMKLYIFKTTNGGLTWENNYSQEVIFTVGYYMSNDCVFFIKDNIIQFLLFPKQYIYSKDKGQTWKYINYQHSPGPPKFPWQFDDFVAVNDGQNYLFPAYNGIYELFSISTNSVNYKQSLYPCFLFPNPASSTTTIKLTEELNGKISAVDLLGNETPLWSGLAPAGDLELDVSHLPAGIYTILINNGYKTEALKMIKE